MLKKKLGKKALAFASAAVMAVSATATGLTALSMTAFAGEELGEGTFENGNSSCVVNGTKIAVADVVSPL